jgi:ABC-type transporter Mla maintaining outer membrane lipid asymmetry ATPase subunit MlaF
MIVTHQLRDAFYVATHEARHVNGQLEFEPVAAGRPTGTTFIMLKDGGIAFEGTADELRASTDPYLRTFLS